METWNWWQTAARQESSSIYSRTKLHVVCIVPNSFHWWNINSLFMKTITEDIFCNVGMDRSFRSFQAKEECDLQFPKQKYCTCLIGKWWMKCQRQQSRDVPTMYTSGNKQDVQGTLPILFQCKAEEGIKVRSREKTLSTNW